jgi:uncharacterized protein YcfL
MELEAKVRLLEKQKTFLEQQASVAAKKAIIFDMMIDIAEKEYQIDIRKNSSPEQSTTLKNNKKQTVMFAYTLFGIDRQNLSSQNTKQTHNLFTF